MPDEQQQIQAQEQMPDVQAQVQQEEPVVKPSETGLMKNGLPRLQQIQ